MPVSQSSIRQIAASILLSLTALAQPTPAPAPKFEVASVKLHLPGDPAAVVASTRDPATITWTNATVRTLLRQAYAVKIYPPAAPGDALATDRYDVIAKTAPGTTKEQAMLMLQALLKERFRLSVHQETKELPIYALVLAKNGPKFHEAQDDGTAPEIGTTEGHQLRARHISMTALAATFQGYIGDPVEDKTQLSGVYDLNLDFTPDENLSANGENLFEAIQRQLGLKLEMQKGPVAVLVVDHVEKPSTN